MEAPGAPAQPVGSECLPVEAAPGDRLGDIAVDPFAGEIAAVAQHALLAALHPQAAQLAGAQAVGAQPLQGRTGAGFGIGFGRAAIRKPDDEMTSGGRVRAGAVDDYDGGG